MWKIQSQLVLWKKTLLKAASFIHYILFTAVLMLELELGVCDKTHRAHKDLNI